MRVEQAAAVDRSHQHALLVLGRVRGPKSFYRAFANSLIVALGVYPQFLLARSEKATTTKVVRASALSDSGGTKVGWTSYGPLGGRP